MRRRRLLFARGLFCEQDNYKQLLAALTGHLPDQPFVPNLWLLQLWPDMHSLEQFEDHKGMARLCATTPPQMLFTNKDIALHFLDDSKFNCYKTSFESSSYDDDTSPDDQDQAQDAGLSYCQECPKFFCSANALRMHCERVHFSRTLTHICALTNQCWWCRTIFSSKECAAAHTKASWHKRNVLQTDRDIHILWKCLLS